MLRKQLEIDEGCKHEIYLDHLGLPTFGIGHLIIDSDPESTKDIGSPVTKERVKECFNKDVESVIYDCKKLYNDFDELPEEAQQIIANMMFNMGFTRLKKFKGMKAAVDNKDWKKAADEMVDSRWYNQVTNRAERLVKRMKNIKVL
tara:strand:- start:649 stop:1086 length:438 start_codon:yes stop_codon:yes gene_type:complete